MKTLVAVLAISIGLGGCAGGPTGKLVAGGMSYKNASGSNPHWFDDASSKNVCYAAITGVQHGLTAISMSWKRNSDTHDSLIYLMMYNPANSKFALFRSGEPNPDCGNLHALYFDSRVNVFVVTDSEWKESLDHPSNGNIRPVVNYIFDFGEDSGARLPNQKFEYVVDNDRVITKQSDPKVIFLKTISLPHRTGTPDDPSAVFEELKR